MGNIFTLILVKPLFNLLMVFYAYVPGHSLGLAIIVLTLVIRLALWPIVGRQLRGQKALQSLQPEISRVKKEAKGDKQLEAKMMMELYREKEINPYSSCLMLVLQLPILLALFAVFRAGVDVHQFSKYLYGGVKALPTIAYILANPTKFNPTFFGLFSLAKPNLILAAIAGLAQYFQVKMITPAAPKDADAATLAVANMGKFFPILTVVISLTLPSALPLYWAVTTLMAILQQYLIGRAEVETMEKSK